MSRKRIVRFGPFELTYDQTNGDMRDRFRPRVFTFWWFRPRTVWRFYFVIRSWGVDRDAD